MSRDFTDWQSTLMHYGVPGMRKGFRKDESYEERKKKAFEINNYGRRQAEHEYKMNVAAGVERRQDGALNWKKLGYGEKDEKFEKEHNLSYPHAKSKEQTLSEKLDKKNKDKYNPQRVMRNRRLQLKYSYHK